MKVLIVGGVAGGASAAARMRRLNEDAQIILFEKGEYISFANCGLPYYIGGEIKNKEDLTLQTPKSFKDRFNVDVRVFNEVTAVNPKNKSVTVKNLKTGKVYDEEYDKLILSPGSGPIMPGFAREVKSRLFTLRNIPDTYKIKDFIDNQKPKTAVVVGGGYIGIEMAENLHSAGLKVTIVELADHVIAPIDYDMATLVHSHIKSKGVNLILKDKVNEIVEKDDHLDVVLDNSTIKTDMLIMSVGVSPDTSFLKESGIEINSRGSIVVNEHMLTNYKDIYAVGDAVEIIDFVTKLRGFIPLAGPANKQGRIAADHINGINSSYKQTQGTSILKAFDLTVATTGVNERAATAAGLNYEKSFTLPYSHATYYPGAKDMLMKLVFEKETGKVLGAQAIGTEGVDKRIDVIAVAIRANMTVFDLTELELAYAPPYSSAKDPVNMAGYTAENIITGKNKVIHWHDLANLDMGKSIILDVRTKSEFKSGHIEGSVNIPVDSLRENIDTLDKSKTYYIVCEVGMRAYIASRILTQKGFESYNLSGGYSLYSVIFNN